VAYTAKQYLDLHVALSRLFPFESEGAQGAMGVMGGVATG
jgi:hypothetical protein